MQVLIRNQLLVAVLALTSACLSIYSAARLFAELSAMGPKKTMQQWAIDGQFGSHAARQKVLSRLLMSLRVSPWNADHHMELARFYTWHMHRTSKQTSQHKIFQNRSQQQILQAIPLRPSWGLAWATLAENSLVSGQYSPTVNQFIELALQYGQYEPGTLNKVSLLGMLHWQELPKSMQEKVQSAIVRALKIQNHHTNLIRLAFSLHWQEHLYPLLQTPAQRAEYNRQIQRLGF